MTTTAKRDLAEWDRVKRKDLLIALIPFCLIRQAGLFSTAFWLRTPLFHRWQRKFSEVWFVGRIIWPRGTSDLCQASRQDGFNNF